ncbi:MAG: hypothetical protein AAF677_05730 [Pseudomonadota bacterium]
MSQKTAKGVGIIAAGFGPDAARQALGTVVETWGIMGGVLDGRTTGEPVSADAPAKAARRHDPLLQQMSGAVFLFESERC